MSAKCVLAKYVLAKCLLAKCLLAKCLLAKCLLAKCLLAKCLHIEWHGLTCDGQNCQPIYCAQPLSESGMCIQNSLLRSMISNMRIMVYLNEIETGKTWQGIRKEGGRVRHKEIEIRGERESNIAEGEYGVGWFWPLVYINNTWESQQHLRISWGCQSRIGVVLSILCLIWLNNIHSNYTESTTNCILALCLLVNCLSSRSM